MNINLNIQKRTDNYGNARYRCRLDLGRIDGKRKFVNVGTYSSKAEAKSEGYTAIQQYSKGKSLPKQDISLNKFITEYWFPIVKETLKNRTYEGYQTVYHSFIKDTIGQFRVREITRWMILEFYKELNIADNTKRNIKTVLNQVLNEAKFQDLITQNPHDNIKLTQQQKEMSVWSDEEAKAFLEYVRSDRDYALWHLFLATGLRRGEATALEVTDFDPEEATLLINKQTWKVKNGHIIFDGVGSVKGRLGTNNQRLIHLDIFTVELLKEHIAKLSEESKVDNYLENNLLFPDKYGRARHPSTISKKFGTLCKEAFVKQIRLHDLRHTHATFLLNNNVPPHIVAQRLGHKRPSTTLDIYSHSKAKATRQDVDLMDRFFNE